MKDSAIKRWKIDEEREKTTDVVNDGDHVAEVEKEEGDLGVAIVKNLEVIAGNETDHVVEIGMNRMYESKSVAFRNFFDLSWQMFLFCRSHHRHSHGKDKKRSRSRSRGHERRKSRYSQSRSRSRERRRSRDRRKDRDHKQSRRKSHDRDSKDGHESPMHSEDTSSNTEHGDVLHKMKGS